jgi:hypothetical protein
MGLRKARKPAAAGTARGLHRIARADELKQSEAYSINVQAVYSGRTCIGFLLPRGKQGCEAFDSTDRSLGVFPDQKSAADALSQRGVS